VLETRTSLRPAPAATRAAICTAMPDRPESINSHTGEDVGAAESRRSTLVFLTKEAVRLALAGIAVGTACDGCPSIPDLMAMRQRTGACSCAPSV
jgi:hypothetical protein